MDSKQEQQEQRPRVCRKLQESRESEIVKPLANPPKLDLSTESAGVKECRGCHVSVPGQQLASGSFAKIRNTITTTLLSSGL